MPLPDLANTYENNLIKTRCSEQVSDGTPDPNRAVL